MTIEAAIYSTLTGHAGTAALVSTRVFPVTAPQDVTEPHIVYSRVSTARETAMGDDLGVARARVQVSCFATSQISAHAIAAQVRDALQRFRGTAGSTEVLDTFVEDEGETYSDTALLFEVAPVFTLIFRE